MPKLPSLSPATSALPGVSELASKPAQRPITPTPQPRTAPSPQAQNIQKETMDDADPWGSPAVHQGHQHTVSTTTNGSNGVHTPIRTTSSFTTNSFENPTHGASSLPTEETPAAGPAWGSYENSSSTYITGSRVGTEGFGAPIENDTEQTIQPTPTRALGGGRTTGGGVEEIIQITLLPEKEGIFMFQHHNYQVASARRGSRVVRRYSDFVWLLDCLQKRYPFRQLPLLPPKRVGGK